MATISSAARMAGVPVIELSRNLVFIGAIVLLLGGCSYTSIGTRNTEQTLAPDSVNATTPLALGSEVSMVGDAGQVDEIQQDAELRAGLLARAMGDYSTTREIAPPEVRWIDPGSGVAGSGAEDPSGLATQSDVEKPQSPVPEVVEARAVVYAASKAQDRVVTTADDTRLSGRQAVGQSAVVGRGSLGTATERYDELMARVRELVLASDEPGMRKALASAGISLLDPEASFNPDSLAFLSASEREQVRRYQQLIVELGRRLTDGDGTLEPDAVLEDLGRVLGERPIAISRMKLCGRVSGFGVYDEMPDATILAGREQPVIVYAELDDFQAVRAGDGGYRVSLLEEVELYNDADGLVVWRQPQVAVTDNSRNRRRDFFVVQLIRLPAQLSVGKYQLKVRITDKANGSSDEATVPIRVVADQALVAQGLR